MSSALPNARIAFMVALDFNYSQQDCLRAWRRHFKERMKLPLDLVGVAVLAVFGCWQWWLDGPSGLSIAALTLAAVFALIIMSALYLVPLMVYRRDEKLKRSYHLRFGEDAIEFSTDNLDSRLGWELYTNVLIDRHSYLLYYGNVQFTIIPAHALRDDESRREFEQLLQKKIQNIVRR
jgi:YcxB-like protein